MKVVLTTPEETIVEQSYTMGFPATNNEVEYEAIIAGLRMATTLGVSRLEVCCDALLMVSQVNMEHATKDKRIAT